MHRASAKSLSGIRSCGRRSTIRLSFAKIASATMSLRCNAFVTVMKTSDLRDCDDPADTRDRPREGTLLVEPQMGPGTMVVEVDPVVWTKFRQLLDGGAGCPGGGPKAAIHSGLDSALRVASLRCPYSGSKGEMLK